MAKRGFLIASFVFVAAYWVGVLRVGSLTRFQDKVARLGNLVRFGLGGLPSHIYRAEGGQLFLGRELEELRPLSPQQVHHLVRHVETMRRSFECAGARFVAVPIPSKSAILDRQWVGRWCAPDSSKVCGFEGRTPTERIVAAGHPSVVDLHPAFRDFVARGHSPYLANDNHLSTRGLALAAEQILRHLGYEGELSLQQLGAVPEGQETLVGNLGLPHWYVHRSPELMGHHPLYRLRPSPKRRGGRLYMYGTSFSKIFRPEGLTLGHQVAGVLGLQLALRSVGGRGPYRALANGRRIGDRPGKGDVVVWEFPSHHVRWVLRDRSPKSLGWCEGGPIARNVSGRAFGP